MIIQGSNDGITWSDITDGVIGAISGTWIDITLDELKLNESFRYFRLYNSAAWYGNLAEVEFYGVYHFDNAYLNSIVAAGIDNILN